MAISRNEAVTFDPALPPHRNARGFHNPPGGPQDRGTLADWLKFFRDLSFGSKSLKSPPVPAGHLLDEATALAQLRAVDGRDSLTWLGHACFLIRIEGRTILTDPYLSDYASPVHGFGPKRFAGTGIPIERLPPIDLILLSHNHYDHLDAPALRTLSQRHPATAVVVPLGLSALVRGLGFTDVHELDWGDLHEHGGVSVTALPAVHFSSRTPFDRNHTLWCGYALQAAGRRLYFSGDTAWGEVFEHVGRRFGPFDFALVPIGAYEPRVLMRPVHANPEDGVRIGQVLRARTLVAMHWGTVALTTEPAFEPPQRFRVAAAAAGFTEARTWVMKIGETRAIDDGPK